MNQGNTRTRSGGASSGRSFSRRGPSRGGFGAPQRRRFGGGGRGGNTSRRGGGGRGGFAGKKIDISRFINKAIITEETPIYIPEHRFVDFNIDERLKKNIITKGYVEPTPIQDRIIPHILRNEDVVGIANTGTGKTGAFLVPLINKVLKDPKEQVLIIVPTRELAVQIEQEWRDFSKTLGLFSVVCVGGANIGKQMRDLRHKNNFIIGTPGRLKDLVVRKCINLSQFSTIVLDEADRMLDMGFLQDMKFMIAGMPKERHTLFFSATLSREIEKLIKDFLTNPTTVSVKTQETSSSVEQDIVRVNRGESKSEALHNLLIQPEFERVLVFGKTKHGVERLSVDLVGRGFKAVSIHGDKNQFQRQRALDSFKKNQNNILVATDVAARGLDISDISHVINYDVPSTYDDYVHRIGRTGRGGKKGKALTFIE
ncbi:MAG: DEAD/DEAH box helicase [Candidatus Paceibacterota bacterium]